MQLTPGKKIYFASDFHLGLPIDDQDKSREKKICDWLLNLEKDAETIYLIGDLFDAWIEYKSVVPRGFVRFLGTLAYLRDKGIQIIVLTGNHDLWMTDYFQKELDIPVYHDSVQLSINSKNFYIHHGDGLGPGDGKYKFLKKILRNKFCQWLYRGLHPNIGLALAQYFSRKGAKHHMALQEFQGENKEWLVLFCKTYLREHCEKNIDYFIFGHRHLALDVPVGVNSTYFNCGDWINLNSYVVFDGEKAELRYHSFE